MIMVFLFLCLVATEVSDPFAFSLSACMLVRLCVFVFDLFPQKFVLASSVIALAQPALAEEVSSTNIQSLPVDEADGRDDPSFPLPVCVLILSSDNSMVSLLIPKAEVVQDVTKAAKEVADVVVPSPEVVTEAAKEVVSSIPAEEAADSPLKILFLFLPLQLFL